MYLKSSVKQLIEDRMLITGDDPMQSEIFLVKLEIALESKIKLVQLRTPGLAVTAYLNLVNNAKRLCAAHDAQLVLNPPIENMKLQYNLQKNLGLHLTSRLLITLNTRPADYRLVGASCHTLGELIYAETLRLDYVLLSPVLATASHPQVKPLGWNKFAELVSRVKIPVYALGGMNIEYIQLAQQHGACGIAGIRGLWPSWHWCSSM